LEANWTVSTVKSSEPGHEWFEATGEGGERLEELAQDDASLSGTDLERRVDFVNLALPSALI